MVIPACALFSDARAGERATLLLASHPDRLSLCNRYQQRLTSTEAGALLPYELMVVVKEDDTLGDGVTRCLVIRLRGETYYCLRGKDGSLPPGVALIREADLLADTLRVLPRRSIVLESPDGTSRRSLPGGVLLVRLFGAGGRYFVREASPASPASGWVRQGDASSWEVSAAGAAPAASLAGVRTVLDDEIAGVNGMLHALYVRQGPRGDAEEIPRLRVDSIPGGLRCVMVPPAAAHAFRKAFQSLAEHVARRLGTRDVACVATTDGLTVSLLSPSGP